MEELLEHEVIPEDEEDFAFMLDLIKTRSTPRKKGVFSPSMLGSCLRQAYFAKRGTEKHMTANPQTNGYFLTGNFLHFKWQFALHKAHRAGMLELLGVEVRVMDGEFGGTIDALVRIDGIVYVVDFKGINIIDFQRTVKRGAKQEYRKQIVGYAKIAAKVLDLEIEHCLLISESKSGPISGRGSPIALHETKVAVKDFEGEVAKRLRTLRWYDHKDELPPISCVSTKHMGFVECPFQRYCTDEVKAVQRKREEVAKATKKNYRVARP